MDNRPVALGARLKRYPSIRTLGFRPNFSDYSEEEQTMIRQAKKIYYPTAFYADLFNTMGKETFPSFHTYKTALDKIRQTALFNLLGIPHPRTKCFYGKQQKQQILKSFDFPFIGKKPRGSARGQDVHLIKTKEDLATYLQTPGPAYIQEYFPIDRDMRVIVIGGNIRLAYFRVAPPGNFRTNLAQGGRICFDPLPRQALDLALETALKCGWDDIGIDVIEHRDRFYVLEGNVKYGTKGFKAAGIDYKQMLTDLIVQGEV